jgi:lactate permease
MFHQLLTPVAGSLWLSFLVATAPIVTVLGLLGIARWPAWKASFWGLAVGLFVATLIWKTPLDIALSSTAAGATFALWPVMWIVYNALVLYNVAVRSERFDAFRRWVILRLPDDRRVVLVVIGFCFGALLEGISGFGTPVAITSALLITLGFKPLDAVVYTLLFNTAPVAFGALGAPVTTLGAVTGLSEHTLGAMIGRQLPFLAVLLPFYAIGVYAGWAAIRALWPILLVSGGSFAVAQFVTANFVGYELTDVMSSLVSLVTSLSFLRLWSPPPDPRYSFSHQAQTESAPSSVAPWQGWLPWVVVSGIVVVWTTFKLNAIGQASVQWPLLHNRVFITLYEQPYAALWNFQPLATGTAILVAAIVTAIAVRTGVRGFAAAAVDTWKQVRLAILTVMLIVGLAYLMNYSGLAYTLGLGVASVGFLFPLLSAFLGWLAVFLSGSDTSGNALFGNLQVVAARQLDLNPVLMAATNSSGGVMGKMISPQNIATGCATTGLVGQEGTVLARTFKHSVVLTILLGLLVLAQQYWFPGMIPQ